MHGGPRLLLWLVPLLSSSKSIAAAEQSGDVDTATVYLDSIESMDDLSNIANISWPIIEAAFRSPNHSDTAQYSGFDWTKPFPSERLPGFSTHLHIADDIPLPINVGGENARINMAALSYGIPASMMGSDGLPKPMDDSWYLCRHYYLSTLPDPTQDIAHDCSFLPARCIVDLKNSIVDRWGDWLNNELPGNSHYMCSGFFELVPDSCVGSLGSIGPIVYGRPDHASSKFQYLCLHCHQASTRRISRIPSTPSPSWSTRLPRTRGLLVQA
jgi:hypothetical protein